MKYTPLLLGIGLILSQQNYAGNKIVQGNNTFACNMYAKLKDEKGNIFFSPYSISTALSMAFAGARGETEKEMAKVLGCTLPQKEFHEGCGKLIQEINKPNDAYELDIANKVFVDKEYKTLSSFKDLLTLYYESAFQTIDFKEKKEAAQIINSWVEKNTHKKIKNIIKPIQLSHNTKLAIANAVYFKGTWVHTFDKSKTKKESFHVDDNDQIMVDMMHQKHQYNFMEDDQLKMLELPYSGDRISMFVLLPKEGKKLADIEETLSPKTLEGCFEKLENKTVQVSLPKFKLETNYELCKHLSNMGMPSAFKQEANFSGISGRSDLYISKVIHKAFIETDEKGTEAAAATVILMRIKSIQQTKTFHVNRPFIFLLKDKLTNAILFMGRVQNPNGQEK